MRRLSATTTIIALGSALALAVPSSAQAAPPNDFGNGCLANTAPSNTTLVMTAKSGLNSLPIAAPTSGVITKATFNVPAAPVIPTTLKTMHPTGSLNQFKVVSESASIPVGTGVNTYDVRFPVAAGDLLGISSSLGSLACNTGNAGDVLGSVAGNIAAGQTATFTPVTSVAVSAVVTVEPDADHDGFGDTTQDLCPQSASFQVACPVVKVDSFASPAKGSITVVVSSSPSATVAVSGSAKVNGKKIKLKGGAKVAEPGSPDTVQGQAPDSAEAGARQAPPEQEDHRDVDGRGD
jgi:hypothetical protein